VSAAWFLLRAMREGSAPGSLLALQLAIFSVSVHSMFPLSLSCPNSSYIAGIRA
jgi:hypothetical protein